MVVYGVGIRGRGQLALTHLAPVKLESFCTVAIFFVQSEELTACTHAHTHTMCIGYTQYIRTAAYGIHTHNTYSCIQQTYVHTIHTVAYSIHTHNTYSCIQHTYTQYIQLHTAYIHQCTQLHTLAPTYVHIDMQRQVKEHKFPPVHTPQ